MAAVVKAVSFQPDVLNYGLEVSKELFGNNFSIFVTYLICNYRKNNSEYKFKFDKDLEEELQDYLENLQETFK